MRHYLLFSLLFFFGSINCMEQVTVSFQRPETFAYTKHAKERMQERAISEDRIAEVIAAGDCYRDTEKDTFLFLELNNRVSEVVSVIMNAKLQVVVTVYTRHQTFHMPKAKYQGKKKRNKKYKR